MAINFDTAFGIHDNMLALRAERAKILASNLVNADTPGYKAKDINFKNALSQIKDATAITSLRTTNSRHIGTQNLISEFNLVERTTTQASLDGNTVDTQREHAAFSQNSMEYLSSMRFMSGRIKGLLLAIRGE